MTPSTPTPRRHLRRRAAVAGLGTLALSLLGATLASGAAAAPDPKISICHATSSTTNPYNELSVSQSSLDGGGANDHSLHTGGVFDFTPGASNAGWGDIIPPFGAFAGLNWTTAGQAILGAGCQAPPAIDPGGEEGTPDPEPCP